MPKQQIFIFLLNFAEKKSKIGISKKSEKKEWYERMKKKSKIARYGGIFFVIIFVALMFAVNTGLIYPKYESNLDTTGFPVVYSKDNTLYIAPLDKKTNSLSDFLTVDENTSPVVRIADNGGAVYFLENYDEQTKSGSLFVTYDGKEKLPITGKAYKNMHISSDGKALLYAENPDLEANCAKLVLWEKGGKKTEIAPKASLIGFGMNTDKKTVYYVEHTDGSDSGDLYVHSGSSGEKIDSDVYKIETILADGGIIYTKHAGENNYAAYYRKNSGEPEKLADAVKDFNASGINTKRFMWINKTSGTGTELAVYDKKVSVLDTGAARILDCDPSRSSVLYTKNFNPQTYEFDVNLIYKGGESEKVASSSGNVMTAASSVDFKKTAYIENGNLYIKEKGYFAEKEPVLIAENVKSFELSQNGMAIAYVSGGKLYLRFNDKTGEVSENVASYRFTPNGDALCYIANYNDAKMSGNLFVRNAAKPLSESVKIDSDVGEFRARGKKTIVYIRNYNNENGEGELCVSRNGKVSVIDSGKIKILCEKY